MHLEQFGWNDFFAQHLPQDAVAGRVAAASREHFLVWMAESEIEASVSGHLRHSSFDWPSIGDWVVLRQDSPVITRVLPRRTKISRKHPGKEIREQILAANIDVLFIVSSLDRDYNPRRLERYLVLTSQSGVRPVILLNKADLLDDAHLHSIVAETRQLRVGTPVVPLSALYGSGIRSIAEFLAPGETGALVGSSGVGKSTLLNALLAEERQRTYPVRRNDQRGRHITTRRELFLMPEGWLLMDLPGLRELHLWADPDQLDASFDDIQLLARNCRFRDCTHTTEPGCAVQSAGLDQGRMVNYRKLQRELAFLERQNDALSRMEHKRKLKQLFRAHERQQRHRSKP